MRSEALTREAIILAGGLGTRLRPLVDDRPKPMADINGRPFLACLLDYLVSHGCERVVLAVGYFAEQIRDHFGDRYRALELVYAIEPAPLGTGGAIREGLRRVRSPQVVVLNGDSYFPVDLGSMVAQHLSSGSDLTMALRRFDDCSRYGAVTCERGRITGFLAKGGNAPGYINGGVYVLPKALVETFPEQDSFSFENDFLSERMGQLKIGAFISDAYFIDIGIPADYLRAREDFARAKEPPA